MTAAAFAKGLLALEGELTPILFQVIFSSLKVLNLFIIFNELIDGQIGSYKRAFG